MATNIKRVKVKDLNPASNKPYGVYNRFNEYFNLLLNSVKVIDKVTGKPLNFATQNFLKKGLFENNAMGYDKVVEKWAYIYGEGLNEEGNPTSLIFVTANGKTWRRKASYENEEGGAYLVKALPYTMSMASLIRETTDFMTNCDVAMRQNLEACKTPYIVICKDKNLQLSFEQALQQKQDGQAVIVVSEQLGEGLKAVDISVPYLVDKFSETRDQERDTLLNKLGIMTANINKKERIQSAEVNATIGQTTDYIYLLIDTFNFQCETYGIPYEMQLNGCLEEIYLEENEENGNDENPYNEVDVNEIEERGQINND